MNKNYEIIAHKSVRDYDGFITDYTLYYDRDEKNYFCIFGDDELYGPDSERDMNFGDDLEAAHDWFRYYGEDDERYEYYITE